MLSFWRKNFGNNQCVLRRNNGICVVKIIEHRSVKRSCSSSSGTLDSGKYNQILHKIKWKSGVLYFVGMIFLIITFSAQICLVSRKDKDADAIVIDLLHLHPFKILRNEQIITCYFWVDNFLLRQVSFSANSGAI